MFLYLDFKIDNNKMFFRDNCFDVWIYNIFFVVKGKKYRYIYDMVFLYFKKVYEYIIKCFWIIYFIYYILLFI